MHLPPWANWAGVWEMCLFSLIWAGVSGNDRGVSSKHFILVRASRLSLFGWRGGLWFFSWDVSCFQNTSVLDLEYLRLCHFTSFWSLNLGKFWNWGFIGQDHPQMVHFVERMKFCWQRKHESGKFRWERVCYSQNGNFGDNRWKSGKAIFFALGRTPRNGPTLTAIC